MDTNRWWILSCGRRQPESHEISQTVCQQSWNIIYPYTINYTPSLSSLPLYTLRCVMEGVRLNPVGGVVRKVMKDKVINVRTHGYVYVTLYALHYQGCTICKVNPLCSTLPGLYFMYVKLTLYALHYQGCTVCMHVNPLPSTLPGLYYSGRWHPDALPLLEPQKSRTIPRAREIQPSKSSSLL